MSLPELADSSITREDAINQIISSIAMEEVSLSHIINAEGEKLQYVLGTLDGSSSHIATIEEVLEINRSIHIVLRDAIENQIILRNKLQDALSSAVLIGPTGPTGPTGPSQGPTGPTGPTGPFIYTQHLLMNFDRGFAAIRRRLSLSRLGCCGYSQCNQ